MAALGGDRDRLLRAFLQNNKRKRKAGRVNVTTPRKGQGESTTYKRSGNKPPGLPSNISAQPQEDSPLFNPLIHGNRNPGRFGTRPKYAKYKGPVKRRRAS